MFFGGFCVFRRGVGFIKKDGGSAVFKRIQSDVIGVFKSVVGLYVNVSFYESVFIDGISVIFKDIEGKTAQSCDQKEASGEKGESTCG